jgi:transposase InsO family protein
MEKEFLPPQDYRLWRYGIISSLLHRTPNDPPLSTMINAIVQKTYLTPHGELRRIAASTIRDWYYHYCANGVDALANKSHRDRGGSAVPEHLQNALTDFRKTQPHWTIQKMLETLKKNGQWDGRTPSKSAIYRFTVANKLNRSLSVPQEPVRSFEYPHFGNLWSADFLHGPKVHCGRQRCKVYLSAIIDDATRYIVAARFHTAEDTRSFLSDLLLAIRRFGIPHRLYTDNGAAFRSQHLSFMSAKLQIAMPHTPPGEPRGRGKIERFFRSVRDGFLSDNKATTLDKINADFSEWLNHYHNKIHSTLGMSPLNRKLMDEGPVLKQIPATQNIDDIFRLEIIKKVGSDGCIRMMNKRFEVRDAVPGEPLSVYYLPWETEYIMVGPDKRIAKVLDLHKNAQRFDKPIRKNSNQKEQNNDKTNQ